MATTTLSNILTRFNRYQTLATIDDLYKVQDVDEAIREIKRDYRLPFLMKDTTVRVFPDVLLYSTAADHDYLVFLDTTNEQVPFGWRMRARYTSLQQFLEDPDYRNTIGEIWDTNAKMLGIRDKNVPPGFLSGSQLLSPADSITGYTASLDASGLALDQSNFIGPNSNASVRFTNTPSVNQALVEWTFNGFNSTDYVRKYFFVWVYLGGATTSITMRFGADSSNYLSATATTQFSGQALKVDNWNLMAFDLSTAATTGTVNTSTLFDYAAIQLNTAAAGVYNVDASYLRGWALLDYWYYGKYIVQSNSSSVPDKEFFLGADGVTYSTSDALIGDKEWIDVVTYKAMLRSLADKENETLYKKVEGWLAEAIVKMEQIYPDQAPLVVTNRYRFGTQYADPLVTDGYWS